MHDELRIVPGALPEEVRKPLREYLIDRMGRERTAPVLDVTFSELVFRDLSVISSFDMLPGLDPEMADVPLPSRNWHQADATGVPDFTEEPLEFSRENPLESDWDPQF